MSSSQPTKPRDETLSLIESLNFAIGNEPSGRSKSQNTAALRRPTRSADAIVSSDKNGYCKDPFF
jgi:hypothetical protein